MGTPTQPGAPVEPQSQGVSTHRASLTFWLQACPALPAPKLSAAVDPPSLKTCFYLELGEGSTVPVLPG